MDRGADWERAWRERYPAPEPRTRVATRAARGTILHLAFATAVLAVAVSSIAFAGAGGDDPKVSAARGEGRSIALGERNPGSGESQSETAIVADAGKGDLVLRPSNTAKGGRAVSATCDNDGTAAEDGCAVYVNKGKGAAASFRTQGAVPFALRDTNTGLVEFLNADMVDGHHASDFLLRTDSSAFLGAGAKAADAEALDGKDSSAFLGATAKAADAETLDGKDSLGYVRLANAVFISGNPAGIGFTSNKTATGTYRVDFPAGTFKTATGCVTPKPMVVAHSDTAVIATVAVGMATCDASDGSGGFTAKTFTPAGAAVDSAFWFMVM
jgi:hypothetical protein